MNDAANLNVESARNDLYRAALRFWAREGKYDETEIIEWFDNLFNTYPTLDHIPYREPVWESFFVRWPINLPRKPDGKVDAEALDQMTFLQRALITAQAAEVADTCATGGGDDTWFDYLPAGIRLLESLQSEEWATVFAEYVDTIAPLDDDERMDAEIEFDNRGNFYVMDVTTPLLNPYFYPNK